MKASKIRPKCLVISGYGINCDQETCFAFESAGIRAENLHVNLLLEKPEALKEFQIIAFPGGFSFADQMGAGNAFALKINALKDKIRQFLEKDRLVIGICNGAQILTRLFDGLGVMLESNDSCNYQCQWVDLEVCNKNCPWLLDVEKIRLPIAHAEGKLIAKNGINTESLAAIKYLQNPNGSIKDIAGVTAFDGKMLAMMPHPERAIFSCQSDKYYKLKELSKRSGQKIKKEGAGALFFKNALRYFD